ncbi:MAG TPA: transposase [Gammaproteobacteria bacterium]|nr:transposase [Gammaproteobacteria bacterium]
MSKRQSFSREFKLEAVRLLELGEKPAADLARELGVPRNRLYKWRDEVNTKDIDMAFPGQGRRRAADAELAVVKRENARLREEKRDFKKSRAVLCAGVVVKYTFMQAHQAGCRVTAMCRVLKVSCSGFYDWCHRQPSPHAVANDRLLTRIREIHLASRHTYGAVKTWQALCAAGEICGRTG